MKKNKEIAKRWEDRLDQLLYECLEVQRMPEKWSINKDNRMVTVYPHPKVNYECTRITHIEYKQSREYKLPKLLQERQRVLNAEVKNTSIYKKAVSHKKPSSCKKTSNLEKQISYTRDIGLIKEWVDMRKSGKTLKEIGDQYSISSAIVTYFINRFIEEKRELA